jgi:hypothetical protein
MINNGNNNTVANNTVVTNGQWSQEAQTIMNGAGIEPAYQYVKTLSLMSSSPNPTGPSCSALQGDANHDGSVDVIDFATWKRIYKKIVR